MLYHLFSSLREHVSVLNLFKYITFRAMLAFVLTFVMTVVVMPIFIRKLKSLGVGGQPIRDDGPKDHFSKKGTPTMGGLVVVGAVLISSLLLCDLTSLHVWLTLFVMTGFCAIGFLDDWKKVTKQSADGLTERQKLFLQIGIAGLVSTVLLVSGFSSQLEIPFLKEYIISLSLFFIPFASLVIVGTSNAVNLTDGLDGLAIGPVMTVAATYGLFAYVGGHKQIADYLGVYHISGAGELSIILAAIVAGGLAFLWFNCSPAQIFMGDTGALALGATLGFVAVVTKHELVLIIAGGVFVVETLSVIIQRYYYKATKKRVFRMAPIHHHFELLGWPEQKVVVRFWIISIFLALLTLTTLKIR
jgi:phospho-N-acetylmuramoyl-pentapeptide-transferase